MATAAGTTSSGQPQPDLISSSLHENHKQTQMFYNSINLVRVIVN
jgi:hypothetical protein